MKEQYVCYNDFIKGLSEFDIIINLAKINEKDEKISSIVRKVALLLLMSKFEHFLESLIEEFVYELEQLSITSNLLPQSMRLHSTNYILNEEFVNILRKAQPAKEDKAIKKIKQIVPLWNDKLSITEIPVDKRFDYGKHGPNIIKKLFNRIGIKNIFETCPIYERRVDIGKDKRVKVKIDIIGDIHSMTNYRNLILHEDASPSLTLNQIERYKKILVLFARQLNISLKRKKRGITQRNVRKSKKVVKSKKSKKKK